MCPAPSGPYTEMVATVDQDSRTRAEGPNLRGRERARVEVALPSWCPWTPSDVIASTSGSALGVFSTVWPAHNDALAIPASIKLLGENRIDHADVRARFIDEAQPLRRITDPCAGRPGYLAVSAVTSSSSPLNRPSKTSELVGGSPPGRWT